LRYLGSKGAKKDQLLKCLLFFGCKVVFAVFSVVFLSVNYIFLRHIYSRKLLLRYNLHFILPRHMTSFKDLTLCWSIWDILSRSYTKKLYQNMTSNKRQCRAQHDKMAQSQQGQLPQFYCNHDQITLENHNWLIIPTERCQFPKFEHFYFSSNFGQNAHLDEWVVYESVQKITYQITLENHNWFSGIFTLSPCHNNFKEKMHKN
jgi:hypothetical protein